MAWVPEGCQRRGRPWRTAEKEGERAGWRSWREVSTAATDRAGRRQSVEALCATWREVVR